VREAATGRDGAAAPTRLWAFYAGGFLGQFGGAMVTPMLPELSAALDTSLSTAASSLTFLPSYCWDAGPASGVAAAGAVAAALALAASRRGTPDAPADVGSAPAG
jgi:hypothetical protein